MHQTLLAAEGNTQQVSTVQTDATYAKKALKALGREVTVQAAVFSASRLGGSGSLSVLTSDLLMLFPEIVIFCTWA